MLKIKSATRLAITIGATCATLVWIALGLNMAPDPQAATVESRIGVTKAIAVTVSSYAENRRFRELEKVLERNLKIDSNIRSIGIRRSSGKQLLTIGPHHETWSDSVQSSVSNGQIEVDILANGHAWGKLEILFANKKQTLTSWFQFPYGLILFLAGTITLMTWFVLSRTFQYLNPSNVVPNRVRSALDTLGSGLVLMTNAGEIAHANRAFGEIVRSDAESILGRQLNEFEWTLDEHSTELPWDKCHSIEDSVSGEIVEANNLAGVKQKFLVNAAPIYGSQNTSRGVLVSFEDVTALESKKSELAKTIHAVRLSRDEIARQNERLSFLASYDPLTQCMNRRSFFGEYESRWTEAEDNKLSIMILDIDHFKAVNDNHGHSTGDEVLKFVGQLLKDVVANEGIVCRYGGEEFVILVPNLDFAGSCELAEKVRMKIHENEIAGLMISASVGVSNMSFGAMDPQHMLDQADQCLYAAKKNGRNQVVRFDQCPAIVADETDSGAESGKEQSDGDHVEDIEYSAVTGLLSALSFRCESTAKHSVRVADLSVALGHRMMNHRDIYRLEIAALLHDVGKVGVPDAILNKPGKLTSEEWSIMRRCDQMSIDIVRSAISSEDIAHTIELHHNPDLAKNLPHLEPAIKLNASILKVCDAFDSMVNDQVYRKGMKSGEAIEEIIRNTPAQFEPLVVERLIEYVHSSQYEAARSKSDHKRQKIDSRFITSAPVNTCAESKIEMKTESKIPNQIEAYIDALHHAIVNEDEAGFKTAISKLNQAGTQHAPIVAATEKLSAEFQAQEKDLDKLLNLADEVLQLCENARSTSLAPAQVVNADPELA